jgi:hypothetical protein
MPSDARMVAFLSSTVQSPPHAGGTIAAPSRPSCSCSACRSAAVGHEPCAPFLVTDSEAQRMARGTASSKETLRAMFAARDPGVVSQQIG